MACVPGGNVIAKVIGDPLALASALRKLDMGAQNIPMQVNSATQNATAHMFIVNPLSGGTLASLFSTHPAMEERIARLEAMAKDLSYMRS